MKTEDGIVIELSGKTAMVKVSKHGECKDCGACPGSEAVIVTVLNKKGARIGQRVSFEVKESNALKAAFIVFVLPLIVTFIGILAGGKIAADLNGNIMIGKILCGAAAFILAAVFIKYFDKYVGKNEKSLPIIVRIID